MRLEKLQSWNVPLGFHQARIANVSLVKGSVVKKDELELRVIYEITSLVHPTRRYVARNVYKSSDSKKVIADLEHLLGDDINRVINLQGEIIGEALVILVDKAVDIEIEHHQGKKHNEPYCKVAQVTNPGGLIERLDDAA